VRGGPVRRGLEVQVRTLDCHTQLPTGFEHLKQAQTVTLSTNCCVLNARWKIADWTIILMKTLIRDKFSKLYISLRDSLRGYGSNLKTAPATSQGHVMQNSYISNVGRYVQVPFTRIDWRSVTHAGSLYAVPGNSFFQ